MALPDYCYRAWQELNTPLSPEEKGRIEREWETELKKKQNKTNMKLKDLLFNREKLRKYDELKEWKEHFGNMAELPMSIVPPHCIVGLSLPPHIRKIILDALEAEIAKLDEE